MGGKESYLMAYRYGERLQGLLLPPCIEDFVGADDPVRAYDAFVDALDLGDLGIAVDAHKRGCPEYSPCVMLKILVFGYAYGIRSASFDARTRPLSSKCSGSVPDSA
jgi:transposase